MAENKEEVVTKQPDEVSPLENQISADPALKSGPEGMDIVLEPPKKTENTHIFKGLKTFDKPEELAKYTEDLEKKLLDSEDKRLGLLEKLTSGEAVKPQSDLKTDPAQNKNLSNSEGIPQNIQDLMYTDPSEYHRQLDAWHNQKTEQLLDQREQRTNASNAFWSKFYQQNQNLDNYRDLVDMIKDQHFASLEKLSYEDASKKISELANGIVQRTTSNETEVVSKSLSTAGTSGESAPRVEAPKEPEVISLVDQLRSLRKKRA